MKKFIPIEKLVQQLQGQGFNTWLDKLTFFRILLLWTAVIVMFGFSYHFFSGETSYLLSTITGNPVDNTLDAIYFSFITATSTGFGDIIPLGFFKVVSIFEVGFGLCLLALVTSKIVFIKQDIILSELYEMSFSEKINRLRSSLLVFRQNLDMVVNKIEEMSIKQKELNEVYIYISSLEDTLNEITVTITNSENRVYKKALDPVNTELLLNSIVSSFERVNELIKVSRQNHLEWKGSITQDLIKRCIDVTEQLFENLSSSSSLSIKIIEDVNSNKKNILNKLNRELSHKLRAR